MKTFDGLDLLALLMVIVGGLNWGLVGIFGFNLVSYVLGEMSIFSRLIYVIVGSSSLYMIYYLICSMKVKKED